MTRRLLALSCRAFPRAHRARTSDEITDTAMLAADGSAWRAGREAISLVVGGAWERLRAERGMSVRSGVALVAQLLALLNLAVALCGVSLVVDAPPYRMPPRTPGWVPHDAYTLDRWWIAFAFSALGVVVGLALGRRAVALGAALANLAIVGYDALVLPGHGGHFLAFDTQSWGIPYPVFWTWLLASVVLVLAVIAAPSHRSLVRLPVVIAGAVLLDVVARAHSDGFFFLQWPVEVVVALGVVFGLWAPRLAVLAIGAALALGPMVLLFTGRLAWQLGAPMRLATLLALCLVLDLLLPLAYLARRRLA